MALTRSRRCWVKARSIARDTKLKRDVAVKSLMNSHAIRTTVSRFQREAEVLASLNHPNVCVGRAGICAGSLIPYALIGS